MEIESETQGNTTSKVLFLCDHDGTRAISRAMLDLLEGPLCQASCRI